MFQQCSQFEKATEMFYSNQYQQGLKVINQCLQKDPNNSILYSNRALFYSQMGFVEEAFADLSSALQLNYLNYIAYFNMFSLLMRCDNFNEAFQNLCCSLSCLYLIRAKNRKNQLDASKSIKYAQNNIQAHVLKGLIHLENGKYKLSLNELDWACEINPSHHVVRNIRNLIFKKMNPGLTTEEQQQQKELKKQKSQFIRLQSSYTYEQQDKQKQLRDRIIQFNEIYNNLNEYQGTITTKVPKQNTEQQPQQSKIQYQDSKIKNQNHLQYNQTQVNQNHDSQQQVTKVHYQNQRNQVEILNQSNKVVNQSNTNNQTQIQQNSFNQLTPQQNDVVLANKPFDVINQNQQNQNLIPREINQHTFKQHSQGQSLMKQRLQRNIQNNEISLIADDGISTPSPTSFAPEPGQYETVSNRSINDSFNIDKTYKKSGISNQHSKEQSCHGQQFYSLSNNDMLSESQKLQQFQSMIHSFTGKQQQNNQDNFDSFTTQNNQSILNQQQSIVSNALYPKKEDYLLQISILKVEILDRSMQQIQEMKNIYCIANYFNVKQPNGTSNFKLRTVCQPGANNGAQWNQTFSAIQIPANPECMKIKVYNKKYSSYRDDLIGQMQVQISTHGLVKLPLFNKKGILSGSLFMNLQLIFSPISQEAEPEQQN